MKKIFLVILIVLMASPVFAQYWVPQQFPMQPPTVALGPITELGIRPIFANTKMNLSYENMPDISLNDFGFTRNRVFWEGYGEAKFRNGWDFRFSYVFPNQDEQTNLLPYQIAIAGVKFGPGASQATATATSNAPLSIKGRTTSYRMETFIPYFSNRVLRVKPVVMAEISTVDVQARSLNNGKQASFWYTHPTMGVGLSFEESYPRHQIRGKAIYSFLDYSNGWLCDLEARMYPTYGIYCGGGYRYRSEALRFSGGAFKYEAYGPYLEVGCMF